jgi:hypothetical protein
MATKRYKISEKAVEKLMKENLELKKSLKTQREVVFDTICEHKEGLSCKDICDITGIAPRQVRDSTQRLKTDSMVKTFDCRCGSTPYYIKS